MNHWMFNCEKIAALISQSMDRKLPWCQRAGLRIHLFMCRCCDLYKRQLFSMRTLIQNHGLDCEDIDPSLHLSPDARHRIKRALKCK
jgi:hypothetical protein